MAILLLLSTLHASLYVCRHVTCKCYYTSVLLILLTIAALVVQQNREYFCPSLADVSAFLPNDILRIGYYHN